MIFFRRGGILYLIMEKKITLKTTPGGATPIIVCPQCGENLTPTDIEGFWHCPYCDFAFDRDALLEDFVATPLLQRWAGSAYGRMLRP